MTDRILCGRYLAWFATVAIVALMAAALWLLRADAVPVLAAGIPILGGLAGASYGIETNWGRAVSPVSP